MVRSNIFVISQTDGRPMYRQIMEHIEQRVGVGDWPPGYGLPSIRELAVSLRVSVITVKRAYQELERDGVIVTQHGKGSFVAPRPGIPEAAPCDEIDKLLAKVLELARRLDVSPEQMAERLLELSKDTQSHPREGK